MHPVGIWTDLVTLVDRPLAHYFIVSSLIGGGIDQEANPLEPILKRYFGPISSQERHHDTIVHL